MIKSKDVKKGTILEILSTNNMMYFGDIFYTPITQLKRMMVGEQYECLTDVKKQNGALSVELKQVNGTKNGDIFWTFISSHVKIVSTPAVVVDPNKIVQPEDSFKLNENEEFVLVHKQKPHLVFKEINDSWYNSPNCRSKDKNDVVDGSFVFNSKSGKRKKFKMTQTLLGFLNNTSGMFDVNANYRFFQQPQFKNNPALEKEQRYHLHALDNMADWVGGAAISDFNDYKNIEVRKYNTETRTISTTPVDFDCYSYVKRFIQVMTMTRLFGEGISKVVSGLAEDNLTNDYPYILSAKSDYNRYQYAYQIPKEKDIYFDLAIKTLKLKKKDIPHYNKNGFVAIAFKTEEEMNTFANTYSNKEKIVSKLSLVDILNHPEMKAGDLLSQPKSNKIKI